MQFSSLYKPQGTDYCPVRKTAKKKKSGRSLDKNSRSSKVNCLRMFQTSFLSLFSHTVHTSGKSIKYVRNACYVHTGFFLFNVHIYIKWVHMGAHTGIFLYIDIFYYFLLLIILHIHECKRSKYSHGSQQLNL